MFEMAAPIQSPTKCEVRSIIWFFNAKGECSAEIHKQVGAVHSLKGGLMFMMNKGAVGHL
jgi:hypothetical protein